MLGIPGCAVVVVKNRRRRSMVKVDVKDKNYWSKKILEEEVICLLNCYKI